MTKNRTTSCEEELAQLEAEVTGLRSMIAYHNRPVAIRPWLITIMIATIVVVSALTISGLFAGQIAFSTVAWSALIFVSLAYILSRKVSLFGTHYPVFDIVGALFGNIPSPLGPDCGDVQARQRISECENRIRSLRGTT